MINLQKVTDEGKLAAERWIALFLSLVMFSTFVIYYVTAVLIEPLHHAHGWNVETLLLVYTIMMVTSTPATIIGGKLRDMFGDRAIILLGAVIYGVSFIVGGITSNLVIFFIMIGVVAAVGYNFSLVGFTHNIGVLFPDKNGLAMGLFYGGLNGIGVVLIPVTAFLSETFSYTITFILLGTVAIIFCFILTPLMDVPPEDYKLKDRNFSWVSSENTTSQEAGEVQVHWRQLLKMPSAYAIIMAFLASALIGEALNANSSFVAAKMVGLNEMDAAWMGSMRIFGNAVGNIGMGFISDKIGAIKSSMITAALVGVAVGVGLMVGLSVTIFAVVVFMIGLGMGVYQALLPVIAIKSYGEKNFGVNFGVLCFLIPVASFVGPQMTVMMPLKACFALCAGACILAAALFLLADKSIKKFKKSKT